MNEPVATQSLLAETLDIKPSQLYVRDIDKVGKFYRDVVGLDLLTGTANRWVLGHDQVPVLELVAKPEFPNSSIRSAGLFHNAIVYTSRAALSRAVLKSSIPLHGLTKAPPTTWLARLSIFTTQRIMA